MKKAFKKPFDIIFYCIDVIINLANMFFSKIVYRDINGQISFSFENFIKSPIMWFFSLLFILYSIVKYFIVWNDEKEKHFEKKISNDLALAYDKLEYSIAEKFRDDIENHDFESAKRVMKFLNNFSKMRKRGKK